jgi:hypothetical protein
MLSDAGATVADPEVGVSPRVNGRAAELLGTETLPF